MNSANGALDGESNNGSSATSRVSAMVAAGEMMWAVIAAFNKWISRGNIHEISQIRYFKFRIIHEKRFPGGFFFLSCVQLHALNFIDFFLFFPIHRRALEILQHTICKVETMLLFSSIVFLHLFGTDCFSPCWELLMDWLVYLVISVRCNTFLFAAIFTGYFHVDAYVLLTVLPCSILQWNLSYLDSHVTRFLQYHSVRFKSPNKQGGTTVEIELCDCQDMRGSTVLLYHCLACGLTKCNLFFLPNSSENLIGKVISGSA